MNNKKMFPFGAIAISGLCLIASLVAHNNKLTNFLAKPSSYSLTFNVDQNRLGTSYIEAGETGETTIKTPLGNDILMGYSNVTHNSNYFEEFLVEGSIYNVSSISGMTSISILRVDSSSSFKILYSSNSSFTNYLEHDLVFNDNLAIFDFNNYCPNYFELININDGLSLVSSITISYSCFDYYKEVNINQPSADEGEVFGNGYYKIGDEVILTATPNPGYIFCGWYTNSSLIREDNPFTFTMGEVDIHYEPKFEKIPYLTSIDVVLDHNKFGISFDRSEIIDNKITLNSGGIVFNSNTTFIIYKIYINFEEFSFSGATLYYGDHFLPIKDYIALDVNNEIVLPENTTYFVIQSDSNTNIITSFTLDVTGHAPLLKIEIPTIELTTELDSLGNHKAINSRLNYVNGTVSVNNPNNSKQNLNSVQAQLKLRGNSTANKAKKPFRIKFDEKQSMFGLTKAKSWALLADYMDASSMHNYTALTFASLIREDEFVPHPIHCQVVVNDVDMGLYLMTEHCDEKEGRLNLSDNDNLLEATTLDEIDFAVERDLSTSQDHYEIENQTYFKIKHTNDIEYTYALKYPEYDDFSYKNGEGNELIDEDQFSWYLNSLKSYFYDLGELFIQYENDKSLFNELSSKIDIKSFVSFGIVDCFTGEWDHRYKSYKLYKRANESLCFGPTWDYDSCAWSLPFEDEPVDNPYSKSNPITNSRVLYCGDAWFQYLCQDNTNGLSLIQELWNSLTSVDFDSFISTFYSEIKTISDYLVYDSNLWYNSNFIMVFDNLRFLQDYLNAKMDYFNSIFV